MGGVHLEPASQFNNLQYLTANLENLGESEQCNMGKVIQKQKVSDQICLVTYYLLFYGSVNILESFSSTCKCDLLLFRNNQ